MIKTKVKTVSVTVETAKNENGELYNMLFVNFTKGDKPYRLNKFLKFAETVLLNNQHGIDFFTIQTLDISKYIEDCIIVKDKNRYGEKKYLGVKFVCGYECKIPVEDDDYFLINTMYNFNDILATATSESNKK